MPSESASSKMPWMQITLNLLMKTLRNSKRSLRMPWQFAIEVLLPMVTSIFQASQLSTRWCFYTEKRKSLLRSLLSQATSISLRRVSQTFRTKERVLSLSLMLKFSKLTLANCNQQFERVFSCVDSADLATKVPLNPSSPSHPSEHLTLWRKKWLNATRLSFTDYATIETHSMLIQICLPWEALRPLYFTDSVPMDLVLVPFKKNTRQMTHKASSKSMPGSPLMSSLEKPSLSNAGKKVIMSFLPLRPRSVT